MDGPWFYGEAGQTLGPVSLDDLLGRLFAMPNPHGVLVWREGQGDWKEAGSVPEISSRLPPPIAGAAPDKAESLPRLRWRPGSSRPRTRRSSPGSTGGWSC